MSSNNTFSADFMGDVRCRIWLLSLNAYRETETDREMRNNGNAYILGVVWLCTTATKDFFFATDLGTALIHPYLGLATRKILGFLQSWRRRLLFCPFELTDLSLKPPSPILPFRVYFNFKPNPMNEAGGQ
nr:hypothetical protein Iba_scaffold1675405CG0010 [Ipomoea batatas]